MKRAAFRIGISLKLTLIIYAVLLVGLGVLAWITYQNSTQVIQANQQDVMRSAVEYSSRTMTTFQEQIKVLLVSVAGDERLWSASDEEAEKILKAYSQYNLSIGNLFIIRPDGSAVGVQEFMVRALGQRAATLLSTFSKRQFDGIWWIDPYNSPLSNWTVTAALPVTLPSGERMGIVAADIPLHVLRSALEQIKFTAPSTLLITSIDYAPILADPKSPTLNYNILNNEISLSPPTLQAWAEQNPAGFQRVEVKGESFSILAGAVNRYGWRVILLYSNRGLQQATTSAAQTSLLLLALISAASLGLAWFIARYFSAPLEGLVKEMSRVQVGQLHGIRVPNRKDEIQDLAAAFDHMMERIRTLIEELRQSEEQKKEAEIRALQSQIRPHFLYNTLSAIGHSAALGRTSDVYAMIQSLTRLLSFVLDHVNDQVTLAQEIEYLGHYIRLQHIRYGNSFQVVYDIAPEVGGNEVLKLTLQPIVENAIFHGLSQRSQDALLKISAYEKDGELILMVSDNGPGITQERLREMEAAPALHNGHIGLLNVRDRLRLRYGEQASLSIETHTGNAVENSGTTVIIRQPARLLQKEQHPQAK